VPRATERNPDRKRPDSGDHEGEELPGISRLRPRNVNTLATVCVRCTLAPLDARRTPRGTPETPSGVQDKIRGMFDLGPGQ
jgi:hypothetical protein